MMAIRRGWPTNPQLGHDSISSVDPGDHGPDPATDRRHPPKFSARCLRQRRGCPRSRRQTVEGPERVDVSLPGRRPRDSSRSPDVLAGRSRPETLGPGPEQPPATALAQPDALGEPSLGDELPQGLQDGLGVQGGPSSRERPGASHAWLPRAHRDHSLRASTRARAPRPARAARAITGSSAGRCQRACRPAALDRADQPRAIPPVGQHAARPARVHPAAELRRPAPPRARPPRDAAGLRSRFAARRRSPRRARARTSRASLAIAFTGIARVRGSKRRHEGVRRGPSCAATRGRARIRSPRRRGRARGRRRAPSGRARLRPTTIDPVPESRSTPGRFPRAPSSAR